MIYKDGWFHFKLSRENIDKSVHIYTNDDKDHIHQEYKNDVLIKETRTPLSEVRGAIETNP